MKKRNLITDLKIIFVIESPLFDCTNLLKNIGYDEGFTIVNFEEILKIELAKETKLSKISLLKLIKR